MMRVDTMVKKCSYRIVDMDDSKNGNRDRVLHTIER